MKVLLPDENAEIEPIPVSGGGNKREPDLDRLSNILKSFHEQFGTLFTDGDRIMRRITDDIALEGVIRVASGQLDADLNVHLQMLTRDRKAPRYDYVLPPKEILPSGVPVYDWSMVRRTVALQPPSFVGGDGSKDVGQVSMPIPLQADDGLYAVVSPSPAKKLELAGIDGAGWWASRNWRDKLAKFDKKTGELIWAVGRRAPGVAAPGQMYHPMSLSGKGGDALFVPDTLGRVWVWHADGLYRGHLFKDHHAGDSDVPVDQEFYGEIQSTFLFTHPQTGKLYHIGAGNETRVHEITVPAVQRLASIAVTLSPDQAKAAQPWDSITIQGRNMMRRFNKQLWNRRYCDFEDYKIAVTRHLGLKLNIRSVAMNA